MKICIRTDNDAFQDGRKAAELARMLRELAQRLEFEGVPAPRSGSRSAEVWVLYDRNGNSVGTARA